MGQMDFVNGDSTGISIPAHGGALLEAGTGFLTGAFRRFGALAQPIIRAHEEARCFLHILTIFLSQWRAQDFGASLATMLAMTEDPG